MSNPAIEKTAAHIVDLRDAEIIDVLGPTIQVLTPVQAGDPEMGEDSPCVMRGTIPPGVPVPLHAHRDPETFLMISGEVEGFSESDDGSEWVRIRPGDIFHVPSEARHAFRNKTRVPAVMTIVSTVKIARFFREVGKTVSIPDAARPPGPPSPEIIRHFLEVADRYGYWNASPEENARIGISLPPV